jgi:hypothetical protein
VLLFANAIIGYWEEREAGNAIDALKARLAIKSRVRRDGKWVTLPAKQLEPGDVIRLRLGDIVPADARLRQGEVTSDIADIFQSDIDATTKQRLVDARLGQGQFREQLLEIWNGKCAITYCDIKVILRASHVKPWSQSNNQQRLDPANGILCQQMAVTCAFA